MSLAGTMSGGTRNDPQVATTRREDGRYTCIVGGNMMTGTLGGSRDIFCDWVPDIRKEIVQHCARRENYWEQGNYDMDIGGI